MGLLIFTYRNPMLGDSTNGGVSSTHDMLCLINASGPFAPTEDAPAVIMQEHTRGCLRIIPAMLAGNGEWVAEKFRLHMAGGNYAGCSDSRFGELCERLLGHRFYGAVSIHDRLE